MLEFIEKPGVVIVLLLALVIFGSRRLPDSARALGRSMRILKAEAKGLKDDDTPASEAPAPAPKQLPETVPDKATESTTPESQQTPHQT